MDEPRDIIQLKIRLLGISPMIWRRVQVPTDTTLRELHGVCQVAMGWEDIARLTPLLWRHINFLGRYDIALPESVIQGRLRPLRNTNFEYDF